MGRIKTLPLHGVVVYGVAKQGALLDGVLGVAAVAVLVVVLASET